MQTGAATRRQAPRAGAALGLAVALACLAACSAGDPSAPDPGPTTSSPTERSASPSPTPEPATASVASGTAAGTVTLTVTADPGVTITVAAADDTDDADQHITVGLSPDSPTAEITLTSPGSFDAHADGSVTVLDADGTPVGGLTDPGADATAGPDDAAGTGGTASGAVLAVVDDRHADLTLTGDDPASVETTLGTDALRSATWADRGEGGLSLAVDPTAWARSAGKAGEDLVWAQLVAAEPDADTPGMHDQLVCHAFGAPDKATWNLEPWRPDVGLVQVMSARCNPT